MPLWLTLLKDHAKGALDISLLFSLGKNYLVFQHVVLKCSVVLVVCHSVQNLVNIRFPYDQFLLNLCLTKLLKYLIFFNPTNTNIGPQQI